MRVGIRLSALKNTRWKEGGIRFLFGGVMTVATGLVAKEWGPAVGGLFLAFPAIFPATATLLESHERRKKELAGQKGVRRARTAAAIDAAGASLGAVGLGVFGALIWELSGHQPPVLVLVAATSAWLGVSGFLWILRRHARPHRQSQTREPDPTHAGKR